MRLFLKSRTRPALCTSAFREILTDTSEKNISFITTTNYTNYFLKQRIIRIIYL